MSKQTALQCSLNEVITDIQQHVHQSCSCHGEQHALRCLMLEKGRLKIVLYALDAVLYMLFHAHLECGLEHAGSAVPDNGITPAVADQHC